MDLVLYQTVLYAACLVNFLLALLLLGGGMLVFWFIYYAVSEYGGVIEIASYAMKINSLDGSHRQK